MRQNRSLDIADREWFEEIGNMVQFAAICMAHDVSRLRVFGSAARGEDRSNSDIDLLVDFGRPKDFFDLIELEERLAELFGRPVDLLTEAGLRGCSKTIWHL